jgi:hypothetical protein
MVNRPAGEICSARSKKFRPFVTEFGRVVKQPFSAAPRMGYFLSMTMQMSRRDIDPRR